MYMLYGFKSSTNEIKVFKRAKMTMNRRNNVDFIENCWVFLTKLAMKSKLEHDNKEMIDLYHAV